MTLARRLTYTIAALAVGVALLAVTPLWVMGGIRRSVHLAYDEYKELRMVDGAVLHLGAVLGLLHADQPDRGEIMVELGRAGQELDRFLAFQPSQPPEAPRHEQREHVIATGTRQGITALSGLLSSRMSSAAPVSASEIAALRAGAQRTLDDLRALSDQTANGIEQSQAKVFARISQAMVVAGVLASATLIGVVGLSLFQYRGVMRPLRRLREGVRRIAAGEFSQRLGVHGQDEIGDVAREFDRMSEQLDTLYRGLEDKVRRVSCELARSERLASVGFLAAGVAHEINTPLNVISGHAELLLRRLDREGPRESELLPAAAREGLGIIREESFRCKHIIERLLLLARPGGGDRRPVDLTAIATEVIRNLRALPQFEHARVELEPPTHPPAAVLANDAELKQVLLNLLLNALQALPPDRGQVRVSIRTEAGRTLLVVEDDGRGMSAETIDRVFEPFFTQRRGNTEPGTGLGLSISHAIIQAHGGSIRAASPGPGQGSRFTVEFPAAVGETAS